MSKPVFDDLFRFSGRRDRASYLRYCAILAGLWLLIYLLPNPVYHFGTSVMLAMPILYLVIMVSFFAVSSQRFRDLGSDGIAVLLLLIPILGWIFWSALLIRPGNRGENKFGPDPLGGSPPIPVEPNA